MLCPSCNKFAAYDTSGEPEVELDLNEAVVTGTARIVLTSECCGDELKEANFDVEVDVTDALEAAIRAAQNLAKDAKVDLEEYELEVSEDGAELTERMESEKKKTLKNGTVKVTPIPFRYQKRFFGVHVDFTVTASKDGVDPVSVSAAFDDEIQASAMDELV